MGTLKSGRPVDVHRSLTKRASLVMITFTVDCVVGRPTSSGAEGRFSVKSIFLYARVVG